MLKKLLDTLAGRRAIRIRTIHTIIIVVGTILSLLLFKTTEEISRTYADLERATDRYVVCEAAAIDLKDASNYLTAQIRMFAVRHDAQFMDNYLEEMQVSRRRENALETLGSNLEALDASRYLEAALMYSNKLVEREYYVMKLISTAENIPLSDNASAVRAVELQPGDTMLSREEQLQKALEMVTDDYYHERKEYIDENVQLCIDALTSANRTEEERAGDALEKLFVQQRFLSLALLALVVVLIATNSTLIMAPLSRFVSFIANHQPLPLKGADELQYLAKAYNRMYEENARKSAELRYQAEHDPLTGLFNRGAFEKLREEHTADIALLIIDVDHFKGFNDTYGHEVGDRVLIKVATLLNSTFRFSDYPCRIGGDEFAVILTNVTSSVANLKGVVLDKVNRVREGLQDTSDGLPPVTLSIGIAFNDRTGGSGDIFKRADAALYRVKERGKNGCEIFEES